jgi:hypothetical protein
MAFIPVPNGIQLCFLFTADSQEWQFCITLKKSTGAPNAQDLEDIATQGASWWVNDLRDLIAPAATLGEVVTTDLTSQGAPQHRLAVGTTGNAASGSPPLNAAAVVSHRTAKRGRSYRGRSYLSCFPLGQTDSANILDATYCSDLATAFETIASTLDALGFDHVVASKQHNGTPTNPAETNEVIEYVVDQFIDSQRRRLTGRGS